MTAQDILARRVMLLRAGYAPLALHGKIPPMREWQKLEHMSFEQLRMQALSWPDAINTGGLTSKMPTLDADILNEDAARAIEDLVRELYEERGHILVRIGRAPKRAFLFRTEEPFKKIAIDFVARNGGAAEKLEFLADGQQVVMFGDHPDTLKPYMWFGGEPGAIKREDLPYIRETEARELIERAAELLVTEFSYVRADERPRQKRGNGGEETARHRAKARKDDDPEPVDRDKIKAALEVIDSGPYDTWLHVGAALRHELGESGFEMFDAWSARSPKYQPDECKKKWRDVRDLTDFTAGTIFHLANQADPGWRERYDSAGQCQAKTEEAPQLAAADALEITQTLKVFDKWLRLPNKTPIYAALGTLAANLLSGDPVWLGIIGPPSSAKTEILNATARLPKVVQAATLTVAGLLSGTPKKQHHKGAQGGLLRQIGDFGFIVLKDFGSILSMHTEARPELLAALREIYDGAWTRHVGSDGGRTLAWQGKVGLLFASTGVIDSHYAVIGSMGDRFLLSRLAPVGRGQFKRALEHVGDGTKQMRKELAEAVARLFAGRKTEARAINNDEIKRIDDTIMLVVRLRGAVVRDRTSRDIEAVYGAEGTARLGLTLERLLAGLDTLGVDRATAMKVVEAIALDSVPPSRRRAYEFLHERGSASADTTTVARAMELPTNTVRRVLEELVAYGLAKREPQGQGKADLWRWIDWNRDLGDDPPNSEEAQ